jgi:hypothetical protein
VTDRCCLTCHFAALRDSRDAARDKAVREMAKGQMVNCTKSAGRASFERFGHVCERYFAAPSATAAARIKWAQAQGATV